MIKLVVSDIDGTLLPEGTTELSLEFYDVVRKLKEKGIAFAAASGRQLDGMRKVFEPVEKEVYFISSNGGYVTCQGEVLTYKPLEAETAREIISCVREMEQVFFMVTTKDCDVTDCQDSQMLELVKTGYRISIVQKEDVMAYADGLIKIAAFVKGRDAAGEAARLKERLKGRAVVHASGAHWIDFTAPGVEKGNALKELQKKLNIRPEETMAFGDNHNDISMLEAARESYAVANAREEVKAVCRHVLSEEGGDSVLHVLKTLL